MQGNDLDTPTWYAKVIDARPSVAAAASPGKLFAISEAGGWSATYEVLASAVSTGRTLMLRVSSNCHAWTITPCVMHLLRQFSTNRMSLDSGHPLVGCRTDSITATKVPVEAIRIRSISDCICKRGKN